MVVVDLYNTIMAETPEQQYATIVNKIIEIDKTKRECMSSLQRLGPLFTVRVCMSSTKSSGRHFVVGLFCGEARANTFIERLTEYIKVHDLPGNDSVMMRSQQANISLDHLNISVTEWLDVSLAKGHAVCVQAVEDHQQYLKSKGNKHT